MKTIQNQAIVAEILLRLPTKAIFKFKSISKSWLQIINNPWFANAYKSSHLPVLAGFFHLNSNQEIIFHSVNDHHLNNSPSSLPHPVPLNLQDLCISNILCSNGFLLLCSNDGRKLVYNPVTGRRLIIPRVKDSNARWFHAFGLIHEDCDHSIKAVFAYKIATEQLALEIQRYIVGNRMVNRNDLPRHWLDILGSWECKTKDMEFKVYCSKKREWNTKKLVSKFSRYVCFEPNQIAGVSMGGNLYWLTVDGTVLSYKGESEDAELIDGPATSAGEIEAKSLYQSANGMLMYCAKRVEKEELLIWELSAERRWVVKDMVRLISNWWWDLGVEKILYVCHEMQAVFFQTRSKEVFRFDASEGNLEMVCQLKHSSEHVVPYLISPWPEHAWTGDEGWPPSWKDNEHSCDKLLIYYSKIYE